MNAEERDIYIEIRKHVEQATAEDLELLVEVWKTLQASAELGDPPKMLRVDSDALVAFLQVITEKLKSNMDEIKKVKGIDSEEVTIQWSFLLGAYYGMLLTEQRHA